MKKVFNSVMEAIGHTPIIRLNSFSKEGGHTYWAKVEYFNPGGSVKDRVAQAIISEAEKRGELQPGGTIIEATSGNTGLGLAMIAAVKGYKTIFVMPDKISEEKRAILRAYGAKVVITPTSVEPEDPRSYLSVARKLVEITPKSFYANQYHNPDNPNRHYQTTGPEIWEQMSDQLNVFVAGAGTGGTISGVGRYLKEKNPQIKVVLADPEGSILYDLFYHKRIIEPPHSYKVEGVGEDMLPDNVHFQYMDDAVRVGDKAAFLMTRELVAKEGLCVGPSSAMALCAALEYGKKLKQPSNILVLFPDNGRGYLSKAFNDEWMRDNEFLPSPLKEKRVKDLLSDSRIFRAAPKIDVGLSVEKAVQMMREIGSSQLGVYSAENPVGLLKEADLLAALVAGKIKAHEPILHVVDAAVGQIRPEASLWELNEELKRSPLVWVADDHQSKAITRGEFLEYLSQMKELR